MHTHPIMLEWILVCVLSTVDYLNELELVWMLLKSILPLLLVVEYVFSPDEVVPVHVLYNQPRLITIQSFAFTLFTKEMSSIKGNLQNELLFDIGF